MNVYLVNDSSYIAAESEKQARAHYASEYGEIETNAEIANDHTFFDDAYDQENCGSREMIRQAEIEIQNGATLPLEFATSEF